MTHLLLLIIYLSFISLGLPDSLLGSAWPSMYGGFGVPISWAGAVSVVISMGTMISSLQSDRLTRRFGAGRVTAASVIMTAAALFGFSLSTSYWHLLLWAVPYGLGAGGVDAALNNFVALHYASRHMSWLHCMWGIGAAAGPYIMGWALTAGLGWPTGYRTVSALQAALAAAVLISLPLWRRPPAPSVPEAAPAPERQKPLTLNQVLRVPGVPFAVLLFFFYCAVEQTFNLWASSYLTLEQGIPAETAASLTGTYFIGITLGRMAGGFLTLRFTDRQLIRLGIGVLLAGVLALLLPFGEISALAGLALAGLGCAPIYPSAIHAAPALFGADKSQAVIGVQMAGASLGTCLMPLFFGFVAQHVSIRLFPLFLLLAAALLTAAHETLLRRAKPL
ncbi:MAG: MFS transporter [Oscillospiraceae bacterium]|nr:MFS transporter [Oscillospiraceae bacterium]